MIARIRGKYPCNLLFFNILIAFLFFAITSAYATITPNKIILLSANMDSLVKSYTKKGYTLTPGSREPHGLFTDTIYLQDGFSMVLACPTYNDLWESQAQKYFGDHISSLEFVSDNADSLYQILRSRSLPCTVLSVTGDSLSTVAAFAIDSCHPIDITIRQGKHIPRTDSMAIHKNHVYRLDWILFSAGKRMEEVLSALFESTAETTIQAKYKYWRLGPSDDFTFVRFEPLPTKTPTDPYWLSIEEGNYYFAY